MVVYIPAIYFLVAVSYLLAVYSISNREKILSVISGMFLLVLSIYIFVNGINDLNNFVTVFFAALTLVLGVYTSIGGGMLLMEEGL